MTETAAAAPGSLLINAIKKFIEDLGAFREALVALTLIVGAYAALKAAFDGLPWWVTPLSVILLVAILYVGYVRPAWRKQHLRVMSRSAGPIDPKAFRLTPYEAADADRFSRPDNAVEEITAWIDAGAAPLIYLSGRSGVGKSSLLAAGVAPKLGDRWRIIQTRPHDDFFAQMKLALTRAFPDDVAADAALRASLEAAAAAAKRAGKRLLLIVDQFEEVFILDQPEAKAAVGALFADVSARPIDNLIVLLSLRADFVLNLSGIGMPPPRDRENWREVAAFDLPAAKRFLTDKIEVSEGLMAEVLREAAEIEERGDQVRPIILNMYGLVLSLFDGGAPHGMARRRLLSDYVRRAIFAPETRQVAPLLVRGLVTELGTKRTRDLTELAAEFGVDREVARGCMVALNRSGLARSLDDERLQWELSHDFVAKLAAPMVQPGARWREQARKWATPFMLAVWLATVSVGAWQLPGMAQGYYFRVLDEAGFRLERTSEGDRNVSFGAIVGDDEYGSESAPPGEAQREFLAAVRYLDDLRPHVRTLEIHGAPVTSINYLPDLPELQLLTISRHAWIQNLSGLPRLAKLESLELANNRRLVSLEGIGDRHALTTLRITGNGSLGDLRGLRALPALTFVSIWNTPESGFGLRGLQDAPELERLMFDDATISSFEGLSADGANLRYLSLSDSTFTSFAGLANPDAFVCTSPMWTMSFLVQNGQAAPALALTQLADNSHVCFSRCECERSQQQEAETSAP
jgi:Leucine-rich repeat (LRR) protein